MKHKNNFSDNIFLLSIAIIIGIIAGSVYEAAVKETISPFVHQYITPVYSGNTLLEVFRNTFISSALFITAAFFLGTSAAGQPFGILLLVYRGFGIGASAAVMYSLNGLRAVPAVIALLLPKAIVFVIISLLAVRELLRSSGMLFACWTSGDSAETDRRAFRLYWIKFFVLIIISLIISVADSLMNYIFAGLL